ncbi:MAG: hypothetical protein MJE77_16805 [Proteobacteria bacterium]|nr:hypothetical protein [Pseudomonadota bacterium]
MIDQNQTNNAFNDDTSNFETREKLRLIEMALLKNMSGGAKSSDQYCASWCSGDPCCGSDAGNGCRHDTCYICT